MNQIPSDITLDILSRLSMKSLLRFKCVSKPWCDIIDTPYLAHMHRTREVEKPKILLLVNPKRDIDFVFQEGKFFKVSTNLIKDLVKSRKYILQGSCNGLLCFTKYFDDGVVILFNPLRQEVLVLPPAIISLFAQSIRKYGLGFGCKTNSYKIVRIFSWERKSLENICYNLGAEVYTLGTESWTVLRKAPPCPIHGKPVFANGALHWIVDPRVDRDEFEGKIVCFDIDKEEFYLISHPEFRLWHLVDLWGSLAIVDVSFNTYIEICMLEDYDKKKWIRKYKININAPGRLHDNGDIKVIGSWEDGEILLRGIYFSFISYNPKTDRLRYIDIREYNPDDTEICSHIRSLVSLSRYMAV